MAIGDSSYTRVYKLLLETPGARDLRAQIRASYETLQWAKKDFKLEGNTAKCFFVTTNWGPDMERIVGEDQPASSLNYSLKAHRFLWSGALEHVRDRYFGKPTTGPYKVEGAVPTFNVRPDVVRGRDSKGDRVKRKKHGETTLTFVEWAENALDEEFEELQKATIDRLEASKQATLNAEDFMDKKKAALRDLARKDMIRVVQKWNCMGPTFIEETWAEAVVAMVMDR